MSSVKKPVEKKRLNYERDHESPGKYDKAFRKQWPKKKTKANRKVRSKVHSHERATDGEGVEGVLEAKIAAVRRESLYKWTIETLAERVARTKLRRLFSVGAKKIRQEKSKSPL